MITLINHQGLKVMRGLQLQSPSPSIGLAYIGGYLKQKGHDYTAIDACGLAMDQIRPYGESGNIFIQGLSCAEVIERIPADTRVIGFTCLFSHCWPLVTEMAKAARAAFPDALLVAGGEHPTADPALVFASAPFDVVVMGEGEETLLELVECVKGHRDWHGVHGVAYIADGALTKAPERKRITEINNFPYPDWDSWCIRAYIEHGQVTGINLGRMMPILGSRGCPYACKFCSNENMWTRRYIMRDPKSLVDEMQFMKLKYNVSGFTFMDSTFIVNRNKTIAFANELVERNLGVSYQLPAGTRCEAFDAELAHTLDKSGLRNFAFAAESASPEILKVIRKQIKIDTLLKSIDIVLETSMTVGCFFVIGFPEDTHESMKANLKLIRKLALQGVHDVTVSQFTPYPGSEYFDELKAQGLVKGESDELEKVIDFYSANDVSYCRSLNPKELYRWMMWLYLNFYVISFLRRPHRVLGNFLTFFKNGVENTRYMRLFSDILIRRRHWRKSLAPGQSHPENAFVPAQEAEPSLTP